VTVGEEIARRLAIPPSTTRRLLGQVKRELAAHPIAGGERVGERPTGLDDERVLPTAERPPEPDGDGQPGERALVALTRQGVAR